MHKIRAFALRNGKEILRDPLSWIFCAGFPLVMLVIMTLVDRSIPAEAGMTIFRIENLCGGIMIFGLTFVMLFTAITVAAGFKGGEIVPSFTVGAAFGCCVAGLVGLPVELVTACGMVGVFCGVTNSPITALLIAFELFGFAGMPYFLITVAVTYMLSGYHSLYREQRFSDSKTGDSQILSRG